MSRSDQGSPPEGGAFRHGPSGRSDAGYVTAETAVVIPSLVLLTAMLMWGVLAAAAQIRCIDAARAGARAAARAEPAAAAISAAKDAAPAGARVEVRRDGDLIRVVVAAQTPGPGRLAELLSVPVRATAVALAEDSLGGPP